MHNPSFDGIALSGFDEIGALIAHHAQDSGHPAICFGDQVITYGHLRDEVTRLAALLRELPLKHGDRVLMLARNSPDYLLNYLAVAEVGAVFIPLHIELAPAEIAYIARHAQPALVIADPELRENLAAVGLPNDFPVWAPTWHCGRIPAEAVANSSGKYRCSPDDEVLICYTSGTTSLPKGVVATHRVEMASAASFGTMWQVTREDIFTVALPLSSLFGLHTASFVALAHGATVRLLPRFNPILALEAIETTKPTVFLGVPTMYAMMLEHVRQTGKHYDTSSIRLSVASGAALPKSLKESCKELLGLDIQEYYALSEVRPVFLPDLRRDEPIPEGSSGYLAPDTEARILDDMGQPVQEGTVGSLFLRASSLMKGYFRDPERTDAAVRGGWFETGDLVRKEGNFYFLVGRTRDQIICGGSKIAATEVEDVLLRHEGVAAAAVVGIPDEKYGQVVKAVVVPREGVVLTAEALTDHCAKVLTYYKVPRSFSFVERLPLGPTGKVLKRELEAAALP
jgi:long-chain acyl-CoA synthetase